MPSRSPEDRDRQTDAAAELADRAADSVDRRYDATKEIYHEPESGEGKNKDKDEEGSAE